MNATLRSCDSANDTLLQAQRLAARGFSVFAVPCPRPGLLKNQPGDGKTPDRPWARWQRYHPSEAKLVVMFGHGPVNIAVVTGTISGIAVVDPDSPEALAYSTSHLPYTPWQVRTARGYHLYYRCADEKVRGRVHVSTPAGRLAIDIRGNGNFVIGAGSRHSTGVVYREAGDWSAPPDEVPVFDPRWFPSPPPPSRVAPHTSRTWRRTGDELGRARRYLAAIPPPDIGGGSDVAVLSAACRLVRGFALSASDAESLLWDWCGGREGWTRDWVARKVANAERYGTEPVGGLK